MREIDVFDLFAQITLNTDEYEKALSVSASDTKAFSNKLKSVFSTAAKVGAAAIGSVTAAATAFAKASVEAGMQFDSSMSQIAATLGLSMQEIENNIDGAGDTFDALRKKALEMGSTTNFTAQQAAEGLNILAMSGYDAEKSMSMIEDVLHLSAAGAMDMASAAGYVAGAMKGFNDETKDSAYYADLMAKGATLANTNVQQLGEALSDGAAAAKSYGQSAETTTLALLRLAEQGEVGSAASTALAAAMKNLYAPTDAAQKLLKKLGVEAFDKSTGTARDFNTVVNELNNALSGYSDKQKTAYAQTIFGIQGFDAYNKMVVTSTEKQNEWAEALAQSAGEAADQYNTMTDNLAGDLDIFNSALDGVKIAVSDKLTPALRNGVQYFTGLAESAQEFVENGGIEQIIEGFISLSPAIAAATSAMIAYKTAMTISSLVDAAVKSVKAYQAANQGATVAQALLNTTILANPFVLITTLIAGVVTALVTLYMTNEDFRNKVNAAWTSVKETVADVVSSAVKFFTETVPNAGREMLEFFESIPGMALEWGRDLIQNSIDGIKAKISALKETVSNVAQTVKDFLGFSEPKKGPLSDFHTYAPDMMQLFSQGIEDNVGLVKSAFNKSLDFGTANVDFASSGLGMSSAGIINSISGGAENGGVISLTINLQTADGAKLASWLLPDLIKAGSANGTPIASGQYA
nr:phage tail tape measure protein [uncultured Oscillibacter sp.]